MRFVLFAPQEVKGKLLNSQEAEEEKLARKFANGNVTPERLARKKNDYLYDLRLLI